MLLAFGRPRELRTMKSVFIGSLAVLAVIPSAAFGYYDTGFLQVDAAGRSQITAFDKDGRQKTFSLSIGNFKAVGFDQNIVTGDLYVLGTQATSPRQCQVFVVSSKNGGVSSSFPSFPCSTGNPRDIETIGGSGEHVIPNGATAWHYNPEAKVYETYRFSYAQGDQAFGATPDIIAIAEPAEGLVINGAPAAPTALDAGRGRKYSNAYGGFQTRGFSVTWNPETDIDTNLKTIKLHTAGPANIPDATGQKDEASHVSDPGVLTTAVSLDQGAGQVHVFYVGVPYQNPYGFGDPSPTSDADCPGKTNGDLSGSLGSGANSVDGTGSPDSSPGFMALCDFPSKQGLANVVALADLSTPTGTDENSEGGGGALDPRFLLALIALSLFKSRKTARHSS